MKNKIAYVIIIGVILILIIGVYFFLSFQKTHKREADILNYKKEMFRGVICEYNCPLKMQLYNNKTQLLPNAACVKNCTKDFLGIQKTVNVTKDELNKDSFFTEIEKIVNICKAKATNITSSTMNNEQFFSCSASDLEGMKQKFSYLN